jgi:hypothetical protein
MRFCSLNDYINAIINLHSVRSTDPIPGSGLPSDPSKVPSTDANDQQKRTFHPEFTYPMYGEEETIFGYKEPSIKVHLYRLFTLSDKAKTCLKTTDVLEYLVSVNSSSSTLQKAPSLHTSASPTNPASTPAPPSQIPS